jgi:hypothetical protein
MLKAYLGWFDTCLRHAFDIWFEENLGYWAHGLRCTLVYFYMLWYISWYMVDGCYSTFFRHILPHGWGIYWHIVWMLDVGNMF